MLLKALASGNSVAPERVMAVRRVALHGAAHPLELWSLDVAPERVMAVRRGALTGAAPRTDVHIATVSMT